MTELRLAKGEEADVALLLEGTYPYISGGVSSWMHQIIGALPDLRFGLVFIGGGRESYGEARYQLPKNVVHLECHYLADRAAATGHLKPDVRAFKDLEELFDHLRRGERLPADVLRRLACALGRPGGLELKHFLHGEEMWEVLRSVYLRSSGDASFIDWFWSVRSMFGPILRLAAIADEVPAARMFHSISTGYAGFLGALLHYRRERPFVLTEHGIYTKERQIDLSHASWIGGGPSGSNGNADGVGPLRRMWMGFFEALGRIAYSAADPIVSLYQGNRRRQIADGAEPSRTMVIPNGTALNRFAPLRAKRAEKVPSVIGLMGRVVPVKDVRTFIRAMFTIVKRIPEAEGWVIGPEDENPEYALECHKLVQSLGLERSVRFLGFRSPDEIFPQLGLVILTSITEALPLVLLEGFASGVPAIATDVGACRELIEGGLPEDRALGSAGAVVSMGDTESICTAALSLLQDEKRWRAAQAAGIARVERFYRDDQMFDRYRALYEKALGKEQYGGDRVRAS